MRRYLLFWLVIVLVVLYLCVLVKADEVETWDHRIYEGTVISGLPGIISLDEHGVSINVKIERLREIILDKDSEQITVDTTTGKQFAGSLLSSLSKITVRTSSGETEIQKELVRRIAFPYKQIESPFYHNTVELTDGRVYEGDIGAGLPDAISIDVDGIVSNVYTNRIITLRFGKQDTIETKERTYQGRITSALPEEIVLSTKFGTVNIKRADITRISFRGVSASNLSNKPYGHMTAGLGISFLTALVPPIPGLPVYQLSLDIPLFAQVGLRTEVGYGQRKVTKQDITQSFLIAEVEALVFLSQEGWRPYLGAGMALDYSTLGTNSTSDFYSTVFVGVKTDLFGSLSVFGDIKYAFSPGPGIVIAGGVSFRF
jgi:hypothetical protein